ncbi:hypothetical protein [Actinomyces oris]|uniref:hypothetical protein n=1 Tax=Actinomyces oris TaxID=544580 RepID=UPI0009D77E3B|nr:hypothetical protein [Actinomyces oris]
MPPAGATPHTFFIALCAIAVTLTLSLGACSHPTSLPRPRRLEITSRTLTNTSDLRSVSAPINGGAFVSTGLKNNILTVASSTSRQDAPRWAIDISLADSPLNSISWPNYSDHDLTGRLMSTAVGALVVSPNGNYVSILIQAYQKHGDESQPADRSSTVELASLQRGYVVVLDARTGRTVLTEEFFGFILAQALTNDYLAVETALAYFPAGEGKGSITAFPFDGSPGPTTIPTDQWLVGAGQDSLLLSPQPLHHDMCSSPCGPFTLTRINTSGQNLGTITHADRVYRGGWVERYKEPAPDGEDGEDGEASTQAAREVVDVDTGAATDLNGDQAEETGLSTGPGLLVTRRTDPDKQSSPSVPVSWLSAADDGHPHTENLEQFTSK